MKTHTMEDIFENIKDDVKSAADMAAIFVKDVIEHAMTNVSGLRYLTVVDECIILERINLINYNNTNDINYIKNLFKFYKHIYDEQALKTLNTYKMSNSELYKHFKINMKIILNEYKNNN